MTEVPAPAPEGQPLRQLAHGEMGTAQHLTQGVPRRNVALASGTGQQGPDPPITEGVITMTAPTKTPTAPQATDTQTQVLDALREGASTVKAVAELTGLARSTVTTHLRHLVSDGRVTVAAGAKQSDASTFTLKLSRAQKAAKAANEAPDALADATLRTGQHPETPKARRGTRENAAPVTPAAPVTGTRRNFTRLPGTGGQREGGPALHTATRTPVSGRAQKGENAKLLLAFFDRHRDELYTARQVRDAVDSRWGVSNALYKLAEAGLVHRQPRQDRPGYLWGHVSHSPDGEGSE